MKLLAESWVAESWGKQSFQENESKRVRYSYIRLEYGIAGQLLRVGNFLPVPVEEHVMMHAGTARPSAAGQTQAQAPAQFCNHVHDKMSLPSNKIKECR